MIKIYPSTFNGTLKAPAAVAHAQRLLFMASVPAGNTIIQNVPDCSQIDAAISCIKGFGCTVVRNNDGVLVVPFHKNDPVKTVYLDFEHSSTTARLAITMAAAFGIKAECTASSDIARRSNFSLISRMALRGVRFTGFTLPFTMQGRLDPGEYVFEGNEGSQFISSLLMSLPLLSADSTIKLSSPLVDPSFVDLTIESLKKFGIRIEKTDYGYFVPGRQYYDSPGLIDVENDWGLAALWIAAGAACGEGRGIVTVTDLPDVSPQLYRNVTRELPLITQDFTELDFDASDCPSLATFYAAMAAVRGATVTITGVPQLKNKETDRMRVMKGICEALGQKAVLLDDGLKIIGTGKPEYSEDTVIDCAGDPWIFMSMALAAGKLAKPIVLKDEHCAEKLSRGFLDDFRRLGGKYEIIPDSQD